MPEESKKVVLPADQPPMPQRGPDGVVGAAGNDELVVVGVTGFGGAGVGAVGVEDVVLVIIGRVRVVLVVVRGVETGGAGTTVELVVTRGGAVVCRVMVGEGLDTGAGIEVEVIERVAVPAVREQPTS